MNDIYESSFFYEFRYNNEYMHLSEEQALAEFLQDLSSKRNIGECVQIVANYLNHQHQYHQTFQMIRQ